MPIYWKSMRIRKICGCLFIASILILFNCGAGPAQKTVIVHGDGIEEWQWSADRLESEMAKDIQSISYSVHGQKHTGRAVSLLAILQKAGVKTDLQMGHFADAKMKNQFLRMVVVIVGQDGYSTAIDLGELVAKIGNKKAWIAIDADGKPLDDAHQPAELIIPDDATPVRWIRGIAEIRLVDAGAVSAAAMQPATPQ